MSTKCRSQWPRNLRRESDAARLLGLWVLIPSGNGCLSLVSAVCCQEEVTPSCSSSIQGSPIECGGSKNCDRQVP